MKNRSRVWFVDVVRLIASFQMINGHTLDALMVDELRQGAFFDRYVWMRGLVSVAFLSVAGLAFHLATLARFDAHKGSPSEMNKRLRRAGILLLLGYSINLPAAAFFGDAGAAAEAWRQFFGCGVLQCIGVALFVLEAGTILARRPQHVVALAAGCAVFFIGLAPFVHHVPVDGAWRPFTAYLSHAGGSLFPLFPWAGYMFAGCVLGWVALPEGGTTPSRVAVPRLVVATLAFVAVWQALELAGAVGPAGAPHATSPAFAVQKLAAVVGIVLFLAVVCAPIRALPKLMRTLSAETLFIYVFHLWFLFGGVLTIAPDLARSLSLPAALAASVGMMVLTVTATVAWHRRRELVQALRDRTASPTV